MDRSQIPLDDHGFLCNMNIRRPSNGLPIRAPFTLRTLLYGDDNLDLTENKTIITETLRSLSMIPKDLRDCLKSVMCLFTIHCKYSISHLLIDVHLYKFFTCLDINKIHKN